MVVADQLVRLHGIDVPELDQTFWWRSQQIACGTMALAALEALIARVKVRCEMVGRGVAKVFSPNGVDIGRRLVSGGTGGYSTGAAPMQCCNGCDLEGAAYHSAALGNSDPKASATSRNCLSAASRFSTISAAITSGGGRFEVSSRLSSFSQKMSRLTRSRLISSS
jgi:hypothetical protein